MTILGIDIVLSLKYNIMSVMYDFIQLTRRIHTGSGGREVLCQKSELKKMNLSTAHFADSKDNAQKQAFCPKSARENITKSLALSAKRSQRLLESANSNLKGIELYVY